MSAKGKDSEKGPAPKTQGLDLVSALNHPLRRRALRTMLERGGTWSPREAADALGYPLPNVAYHFRVLADKGAVTLAEARKVIGTTQHFYRPSNELIDSGWATAALHVGEASS